MKQFVHACSINRVWIVVEHFFRQNIWLIKSAFQKLSENSHDSLRKMAICQKLMSVCKMVGAILHLQNS